MASGNNIIYKEIGGNAMLRGLKKTIAVCLIGFGVGTIMVLILPVTWWLMIIGIVVIAIGVIWLAC